MNITVYLGAYEGNDPSLRAAVEELGTWIGQSGNSLVYGGSKSGLMGLLATSVMEAGGRATGVEPKAFIESEMQYDELTELIVTEDMAERKAKMIELGDAFIAFPGGTGTLEEITEIMSKVSLKLLDAPCIIYNLNGYYDSLKALLDHMTEKGLSSEERQKGISFAEDLDQIKELLGSGTSLMPEEGQKYSGLLNGFWEEGYHYYIEIGDDEMTVRNYMRKVSLRTHISYDAACLEAGERTVISMEDNVLSRDASGEPFTMIKELAYEDGELRLLYYYTIMGETLYTLKKTEHGPFDHIIIRDEEYLGLLQGEWVEWRPEGSGSILTVNGDRLSWHGGKELPFHVVSTRDYPDEVRIVPADLTEDMFPGFTSVTVRPDMLTTYMIVYDMSVPMTVFARRDMLGRIEIPDAARTEPHSMMMNPYAFGADSMTEDVPEPEQPVMQFCPNCGYKVGADHGNFCPECGYRL